MDRIRLSTLPEGVRDARAGRVVFLSHCLLNQNVRYLGGAFRAAAVDEVIESFRRDGVGICQLRCPEEVAWGGVLKRLMLAMVGTRGTIRYSLRRPLLALFGWYTRIAYDRLAAAAGRQIADYVRSGFEVVGVVGVADSPSCGVMRTLDLQGALDAIADVPLAALTSRFMNERVVAANATRGQGWFIKALSRWLARRGLSVPFFEIDPTPAMQGAAVRLLRLPIHAGSLR
jgi:uncharacterized protein YbbK (DUF523 family)